MISTVFLDVAALHIPDGYLSPIVAATGWMLAIMVLAFALRKSGELLGERQVPLLGVLAAFVFAAQSINFPIIGGTSGHLLGSALLAIILGPWPAILVMTVVVGLQALLFQDGGLLAIGWNVVNMSILAVLSAAVTFRLLRKVLGNGEKSLVAASLGAAWLSVVLSATATGVELAISDPGLFIALPTMSGIHALIGIVEALITGAAVLLISRSRSLALASKGGNVEMRSAFLVAGGLIIALVTAVLSVLSSSSPDGLQRVALDFNFSQRALEPIYRLLPDYSLPFFESPWGGILAVVIGTVIAFALVFLAARLIRRRYTGSHDTQQPSVRSSPGD